MISSTVTHYIGYTICAPMEVIKAERGYGN